MEAHTPKVVPLDLQEFEVKIRLDELKRLPHRHGYGKCQLCERISELGGMLEDLSQAGEMGCLK